MGDTIVALPIVPLRVADDVTDADLASRIRRGDVTREEIEKRFLESTCFADWMQRTGLKLWRSHHAPKQSETTDG